MPSDLRGADDTFLYGRNSFCEISAYRKKVLDCGNGAFYDPACSGHLTPELYSDGKVRISQQLESVGHTWDLLSIRNRVADVYNPNDTGLMAGSCKTGSRQPVPDCPLYRDPGDKACYCDAVCTYICRKLEYGRTADHFSGRRTGLSPLGIPGRSPG